MSTASDKRIEDFERSMKRIELGWAKFLMVLSAVVCLGAWMAGDKQGAWAAAGDFVIAWILHDQIKEKWRLRYRLDVYWNAMEALSKEATYWRVACLLNPDLPKLVSAELDHIAFKQRMKDSKNKKGGDDEPPADEGKDDEQREPEQRPPGWGSRLKEWARDYAPTPAWQGGWRLQSAIRLHTTQRGVSKLRLF